MDRKSLLSRLGLGALAAPLAPFLAKIPLSPIGQNAANTVPGVVNEEPQLSIYVTGVAPTGELVQRYVDSIPAASVMMSDEADLASALQTLPSVQAEASAIPFIDRIEATLWNVGNGSQRFHFPIRPGVLPTGWTSLDQAGRFVSHWDLHP